MDIMMPEMDGYETMQVIRQNPMFRRLPIIKSAAPAMPVVIIPASTNCLPTQPWRIDSSAKSRAPRLSSEASPKC
jgi:CheY-like chemotaxis protein